MRLIDADKIQYTSIAHLASYPVAPSPCDTVMRAEINAIPTVDAVPVVHGKWDKGTDSDWHICEECGAEVDISMGTGVWVKGVELYELKYCPYCGAKMDEVKG